MWRSSRFYIVVCPYLSEKKFVKRAPIKLCTQKLVCSLALIIEKALIIENHFQFGIDLAISQHVGR